MDEIIEDLEQLFLKKGDKAYAKKQQAYLKGHFPFFGITKPELKLLQRSVFKKYPLKNEKELHKLIQGLWKREEREFHYAAMEFARCYQKLGPTLGGIVSMRLQSIS
jgi:3-methyladenine DNA glycosylase AlkD